MSTITLVIVLLLTPAISQAQYTTTVCQVVSNTVNDALIAPDRNDFAHNNLPVVNEAYLHNFDPPTLPCGIVNPNLISLIVTIDLMTINTSTGCVGIPNCS